MRCQIDVESFVADSTRHRPWVVVRISFLFIVSCCGELHVGADLTRAVIPLSSFFFTETSREPNMR